MPYVRTAAAAPLRTRWLSGGSEAPSSAATTALRSRLRL
jgi:hypothetical protein